MKTASPAGWPKLSVVLDGPREPGRCQRCGVEGTVDEGPATDLQRWREHDTDDRPTGVVVVLCRPCADRIIESHPRLYSLLGPFAPFPGTHALCLDCRHRDGVRCAKARLNGGPGVVLVGPKPTLVHIYRRGKGARSGWERIYYGPPKSCDGKEARA